MTEFRQHYRRAANLKQRLQCDYCDIFVNENYANSEKCYNQKSEGKQRIGTQKRLKNYNVTLLLQFPQMCAYCGLAIQENRMTIITTAVAALLLSSAPAEQAATNTGALENAALASDHLAKGQAFTAIDSLEKSVKEAPQDPALLINLGIAHAQAGDASMARTMFERALVSREPVELETADGGVIDSRRLARKAIRMLERGEFTTKLTRRD